MNRCHWCGNDPLYVKYHDEEWGIPVHTDKKHFEFLVLESAQAGLSWITILRKRENYRKAYDDFDYINIAQYDKEKVAELVQNPGIIRNKLKIAASINNALMFIKIQEEFGSFDAYIWAFVDNKPLINHWDNIENVPATSDLSDVVSKDLKKRGFKFIGSTITYAHLQATGIINDHITSCFKYIGDLTVK
ncbi:DNA-3-methyladenine glycosylase I [Clostridium bowmanii]|uniref:DNA-3-methyladenine glycosylase I n=1 Tax=Clostridium bowmanii TaxID=132925 RepID=UPI001C0B88C7|nr:DNA-3-methyladenine glycosylase I [Clostridium bowmanii]MBU3192104.1 DNA-3-methyladenine glycosylase I [Clostridium bowmanii]MCA1076355.1 DNA-3-methyladenine glycosylase I [Clostridium bowmanii]